MASDEHDREMLLNQPEGSDITRSSVNTLIDRMGGDCRTLGSNNTKWEGLVMLE